MALSTMAFDCDLFLCSVIKLGQVPWPIPCTSTLTWHSLTTSSSQVKFDVAMKTTVIKYSGQIARGCGNPELQNVANQGSMHSLYSI